MTIKEFFSFKKNRLFWLNIILLIAVACLSVAAVFYGLNKYTRHGQAIVVPDVVGMTFDEAKKQFADKGLKVAIYDSIYIKEKAAGVILDYLPAKGQKVKEGRIIYLTINTNNIPTKMVPDVADNSSLRQAQARLLAAGFKLAPNELVSGEKDWVYEVKYKGRALNPDEKVPTEAMLTLVVGDGNTLHLADSLMNDSTNMIIDESWFD